MKNEHTKGYRVSNPDPENNNIGNCRFDIGIDVWYSDIHTIKSKEDAIRIADIIDHALQTNVLIVESFKKAST